MRWAFSIALSSLLVSQTTFAQRQTELVTEFQPIANAHDTLGAPSPFAGLAVAPLRLALQSSILARGGDNPGCASRSEPSGNSVGGIPIAFHGELHLTPSLTLAGFSQLGCPLDATLGAVAAITIPIRTNLALVLGAGIIMAPGQIPLFGSVQNAMGRGFLGTDSAVNVAARADLMWKTKGGRTFSVGVGSIGRGHQGVSFGGGF